MTTLAVYSPLPFWPDLDGSPLDNGKIYFGVANENPVTAPIQVYWDAAKTQPAGQPVKTLNGMTVRNGSPAAVFIDGDFSVGVYNKRGSLALALGSNLMINAAAAVQAAIEAEFAAPGGSARFGFLQSGSGAVARTGQDKLRDIAVSPADFGAIGDDTADDTAALKDTLAAGAGRDVRLTPGKTYLITDELVMPPYTRLWMMGSTLHFAHTDPNKRCLALTNGCEVDMGGGTVNNSSTTVGSNGTNQTPIVVGVYTSTNVVRGWAIRNGNVTSSVPGGNGIAAIGAADGVIERVHFPDSAALAIGVIVHWAFDGGPTTPYTGITAHAHNIRVENISAGAFTYNAGTWRSIVFLSAAYNIQVSNIYADSYSTGKEVTVYAGDWGFRFGTTLEQRMGLAAISIRNVFGRDLTGVHIYGVDNGSQGTAQVWPGSITIDNVAVWSNLADPSTNGVRLEGCDNVSVRHCVLDSFEVGVAIAALVTRCSILDNRITGSVIRGIDATAAAAGSANITIKGNEILGTNTSATANRGDIEASNINNLVVAENSFNSSNATWSLRCDNTCTRVRARKNHTYNVLGTSTPYAFGSAADTAIVSEFEDNTCDDAPSAGLRSGQIFIPALTTMKNGSNDTPQLVFASAMPDRGSWSRGTMVVNDQAASGSPKGWLRVTTGSGNVLNTDWYSLGNL